MSNENFTLQQRLRPAPNDPSIPSTAPKASASAHSTTSVKPKVNIISYCYDSEKGECCGRTFKSWICILAYSIIYLMFLTTFMLILLYISLFVLKQIVTFKHLETVPAPLTYPEGGIGLTATPTSENSDPLIWYKSGEKSDYEKYTNAIEKLLSSNRTKRDVGKLGPCGQYPYGYGASPCILIRINRIFRWAGRPLQENTTAATLAPPEVKEWMKKDRNKLWLQCDGYHSYDKEHIGRIKYYPDPPGLDANLFPLGAEGKPPLIAIQLTDFTLGISLAVECKLWFEKGPSTVAFVIYVAPNNNIV